VEIACGIGKLFFVLKLASKKEGRSVLKVGEVKNPALYGEGLLKIDWVKRFMPVCGELEKAYAKEKPFQGLTIAMCIHLEAKTARLALLLRDAGAKVVVTGSNPLSTQTMWLLPLSMRG